MANSSSPRKWFVVGLLAVAVVVAGYYASITLLGVKTVRAGAFTAPGEFGYTGWGEALRDWVVDGRVDYARVMDEQERLRSFASLVREVGPTSDPNRFPDEAAKLAYYINAYNALVLLGVAAHWPIDSVQDVHGPIEPRAGFGFFYGLRFEIDQRTINLYDLEHQVIRGFGDARIHAAINCASVSCPALQSFAYLPEMLDAQLTQVTREFCSSPKHVHIDHEARVVELSAIFDWYQSDFVADAAKLGQEATVLGFVAGFADEATATSLTEAMKQGYTVRYLPYDWSLNRM